MRDDLWLMVAGLTYSNNAVTSAAFRLGYPCHYCHTACTTRVPKVKLLFVLITKSAEHRVLVVSSTLTSGLSLPAAQMPCPYRTPVALRGLLSAHLRRTR
jgi:hypothetical protein